MVSFEHKIQGPSGYIIHVCECGIIQCLYLRFHQKIPPRHYTQGIFCTCFCSVEESLSIYILSDGSKNKVFRHQTLTEYTKCCKKKLEFLSVRKVTSCLTRKKLLYYESKKLLLKDDTPLCIYWILSLNSKILQSWPSRRALMCFCAILRSGNF